MRLFDLLHHDLELNRGLVCPKCRGTRVRGHSTPRSVLISLVLAAGSLLGVLALTSGALESPSDTRAWLVLALALGFLVAVCASAGTLISALLGRNRCVSCNHTWR